MMAQIKTYAELRHLNCNRRSSMGSDIGLIIGAWILTGAIDRYIAVLKQIHGIKEDKKKEK